MKPSGKATPMPRYLIVPNQTLTSGLSRWLHQDLPHRIERATGLAVPAAIGPSQPTTTAAGPG
jgi:hypothetical protein